MKKYSNHTVNINTVYICITLNEITVVNTFTVTYWHPIYSKFLQ